MVFDMTSVQKVVAGTSGRILAPMPDGSSLPLRIDEVLDRAGMTQTLIGEIEEEPETSDVLMVFHDGILHGTVARYDTDQHIEFRILESGYLMVRELDGESMDARCGGSESESAEALAPDDLPGGEEPFPQEQREEFVSGDTPGWTTMDAVVGYGIQARTSDGGYSQIEARIIASVDRMNLAFSNSQVAQTETMLLGTIEDPDYVYPGAVSGSMGSSDELGDLNNTSSDNSELNTVSNYANLLGADLKAFVLAGTDGSAGVAYRPGTSSITARTYMASNRITFAHELGHNIGAYHSWGDSGSDSGTTIYSYGWRLALPTGGQVRTIMSYDWGWTRIPYYANPAVEYQNARTGQVNGYNATGDSESDPRYISGGYIGTLGAGFNGTNPSLGARNGPYIQQRAPSRANLRTRSAFDVQDPTPGETWTQGDSESISWSGADYSHTVSVDLYKGGVFVSNLGSGYSGIKRDQTIAVPTGLPAGNDFMVRVTLNGSQTADSGLITIIGDTLPSSQPDLLSSSDSGALDFDNITSDRTPTFTGLVTPNTLVTLSSNLNGVIGSTTTNGAGNWTITTSTLNNGAHQIVATTVAGGDSQALPVTIDSVAPSAPNSLSLDSATDSGRFDNDRITSISSPRISGNAETGTAIALFQNGSPLGTTTAISGAFAYIPNIGSEGTHSFTAHATDLAGNQSPLSSALNVEFDFTAPPSPGTPTLDPASDSGDSNSDRLTNIGTPTFTGTGLDEHGILLVANDQPSGDGTVTGTSWSVVSSLLEEGLNTITAQQEDLAGNISAPSLPLEITIDRTRPLGPANFSLNPASDLGFSDSDGITNDPTPTFTGNAEAGTTVRVFRAGSVEIASGLGENGFQLTSVPLSQGPHSITARTYDAAGNVSLTPPAFQIEIDTTPPQQVFGPKLAATSDSGVSDSDRITNDNTPEINGLSILTTGGTRVHFFLDGVDIFEEDVTGNWAVVLPELTDGVKDFVLRNEDIAGNLSTPVSLELTIDTTPPAAPFDLGLTPETDTGTSDSDAVTKNTSPVVTGSSEPGEVNLFQDGNSIGTVLSDGTWTLATSDLPEGTTTFTASQSDLAGNDGNLSAPLAVTVDVTAPGEPTMPAFAPGEDTGSDNNDGLTNRNTPTFTGDAEAGTLVILFDGEGNPIGQGLANSPWSITTEELPDGPNSVTASASDPAGNLSPITEAMDFEVDSTRPTVTVEQAPTQADPTIDEPIEFLVTFSEPVTGFTASDVAIGGTVGGTASVSDGATPGVDFLLSISGTSGEGTLTASVNPNAASDAAGNFNPASTSSDNSVEKREVPGPVAGVSATDGDFPDKVTVSWVDSGASTYRVFRHPFQNPSAASEIGSVGSGNSTFDDVTATPDLPYFYWVRAEDVDGVGDFGTPDSGFASSGDESKNATTPIAEAPIPDADPVYTWTNDSVGLYDGLLRDAEDDYTIVGGVSRVYVSTPRPGSYRGGGFLSASLFLQNKRAVIRGSLNGSGTMQGAFRQTDGSTLTVKLQVFRTATSGRESETLKGTISWHGITANIDLARAAFHPRLNPSPEGWTGAFTMILPALPDADNQQVPGGDGWARVNVNAGGKVQIVGALGDGTRFSESACLSNEGEFFLYRWLYRPVAGERGFLGARLVFRNLDPDISDFDGVAQWNKVADTRERRYPDGFSVEAWALGSRYQKPARGERALASLADQYHNSCLALMGEGGPDNGDLERSATWMTNNRIAYYGPERASASVQAANGGLTGFWFDPESRTRWPFTGVVFQAQQIVAGHFLNTDSTGKLAIKPSTETPYPGSEDAGATTRFDVPDPQASPPDLTDANWDRSAAGVYGGVTSMTSTSGGLLSLKVTPAGAFSGVFEIDGERRSFRGTLDENGFAQFNVPRGSGLPDGVIILQLKEATAILDESFQIAGTIDLDGDIHDLDAQRKPSFSRSDRCPQEGLYNLAMRAPDNADASIEPAGDGCGSVRVNFLGIARGLFTLADGTRTPLTGHVSRAAEWSLYRPLHGGRGKGSLAGKLTFRGTPADPSQVDGAWHWEKGAGVSSAVYPGGISSTRGVVGNLWTPVARGEFALPGLDDANFNAWARFLGPGLDGAPTADFAVTWANTNRITYHGPEQLTISVNPRTGLVSGRLFDRTNGINVRFKAVILPSQEVVPGAYLHQGESGLFSMEKR